MICEITNKKTKVTQLCSNDDVIKSCKKSTEYTVKEVKKPPKKQDETVKKDD